MATVKCVLNLRYQSKDKTYPIIIRVIDGKKMILHPIGYKARKDQFKDGEVRETHPDSDIINSVIFKEMGTAKNYIAECRIKDVPLNIENIFSKKRTNNYTEYLRHRQQQYYEQGMIIMSRKVRRWVNDLSNCFGRDISFEEIDFDMVKQLNTYLIGGRNSNDPHKKPNKANTRIKKFGFYAQFYREGTGRLKTPFDDINIMAEPVNRIKLTEEEVSALETVELTKNDALARDMYLFSYYCNGARFENVLTMQRKFIYQGRITYRSNKGKKIISAAIHTRLKAIIDKYNHSPLIFPLLKEGEVSDVLYYNGNPTDFKAKERYAKIIDAKNVVVNKWLRRACRKAGIREITFHIARHTVAYHLKRKNVSVGAIRDLLGQSSERITEHYLKSLDTDFLDNESSKLYGV